MIAHHKDEVGASKIFHGLTDENIQIKSEIAELNLSISKGYNEHHKYSLQSLERRLEYSNAPLRNQSNNIEEIKVRVFRSAKGFIADYNEICFDFKSEYISEQEYVKYLIRYEEAIPICLDFPSLKVECDKIAKDIETYLNPVQQPKLK